MKIINLDRGQGKTIRLLYASEFNNIPILCPNSFQKDDLLNRAKVLGLKIPDPIYVGEITSGKVRGTGVLDKDLLVDEAPWVLRELLRSFGATGEVKAITLTSDER